ncbi:hypothetical protein JOQ06_016009 [Pogonophryne albipinna]|uniref:Uncharacterized protein n=1 Tax=Pogonophryne albipinna TaxID=1090488 RepID=A0AAD6FBY2_9TELE|nr:hypothetical protein JOQ06_016009 [Pogonophryne albipinna]
MAQAAQTDKEAEGEEEPLWKVRPLHGIYRRQTEGVADIDKSYQWLKKAGLNNSTEALIMAEGEQALSSRSMEADCAGVVQQGAVNILLEDNLWSQRRSEDRHGENMMKTLAHDEDSGREDMMKTEAHGEDMMKTQAHGEDSGS